MDCTRWFIDLIQWAEHYHIPSLLISLDAEKHSKVFTGYIWVQYSGNLALWAGYFLLASHFILILVQKSGTLVSFCPLSLLQIVHDRDAPCPPLFSL